MPGFRRSSHLTYSVPSLKANVSHCLGYLRSALAACCLLWATVASAQRVQFPTMIEQPSAVAAPTTTSSGFMPVTSPTPWSSAQGTFAAPSNSPISSVPYDPYTSPLTQSATAAPQAFPPPAYSPYAASPYAAPPTASPFAATPYAPAPYSATPSSLYPEGIAITPPSYSFNQTLRFMQDLRLRWTWLSPMGSNSLGVNDVETNATFAVPFFKTTSPLMFTPGFGIHLWEGPVTEAPLFAELPPNTYDAFLDTAWYPQINNWLSAQVGVRIGAYTDFNTFVTNSIRVMGRGLGVVAITPRLQFALGVVYLDRVKIKLLPAGGLIWTPHQDARYEILFPNPKLSRRITTLGNNEIWLYGTGEYGGGSWTADIDGGSNQFDYNDIRVAGGIESFGLRGFHSYFEVGYVFSREIVYRYDLPEYSPSDTLMLRAGVAY
jgi:hypothetical protein